MRHSLAAALLLALTASLHAAEEKPPRVVLRPILKGMQRPVQIVTDGSDRLFILEQVGLVRLYRGGKLEKTPYLDFKSKVFVEYECGLLGLAFHPDFKANGLIYLNYTAKTPNLKTIISELKTDPKSDAVDLATERIILTIDQPYPNHNGGHLEFGPDGMLYIGMGDGGDMRDPHNHGQRTDVLLAKMLRIDVSPRQGYKVPPDNPFVGDAKVRPEIWATGIRNPWRFSFDRVTGLLYLADVGQDKWEEVNIIEKGGNYGWKIREGAADLFPIPSPPKMIDPIFQYAHENNAASITGGLVYRGKAIPALHGWYIFGDYVFSRLWAIKYDPAARKVTASGVIYQSDPAGSNDGPFWRRPTQPSCFGEDSEGNIYMADQLKGMVFKLELEIP